MGKTFAIAALLAVSSVAFAKSEPLTFKNVTATYNRANRADTLQIHAGTYIPLKGQALRDFNTDKNSGLGPKVVQLKGGNDLRQRTFAIVSAWDNGTNYAIYNAKTQKAIAY